MTVRPRKKDRHLPARMYHRHGRHWYVVAGKWTALPADLPSALAEYARITAPAGSGMAGLIDRVLAEIAGRVKPSTLSQYRLAAARLKTILADFAPEQVRPRHVAAIKQHFAATPNMANRILSFLRVVFARAVEWQEIDANPCIGVRRHAEKKRGRYITDDEFRAVRAAAPAHLAAILDIAYLTGQRIGDVLAIRHADISDAGIAFCQQKTGKRLVVRMSAGLRAAVERAKAGADNVRGLTLFHTRGGRPWSYYTIRDQFDRACATAGVEDFHLHDLRAKALTDAKRQGLDPQKLGGHQSAAMTDRYIRQREIDVAEPPELGGVLDSASIAN